MDLATKEAKFVDTDTALAKFAEKLEISGWAAKNLAKTAENGLALGNGESLEPKENT